MKGFLLPSLAAALVARAPTPALPHPKRFRDPHAPHPTQTVYEATVVLTELSEIPARYIPPALLTDAHGVAVIPHAGKAGPSSREPAAAAWSSPGTGTGGGAARCSSSSATRSGSRPGSSRPTWSSRSATTGASTGCSKGGGS